MPILFSPKSGALFSNGTTGLEVHRLLGNPMRLSHKLTALAVCAATLVVSTSRCQGQEQSDSKPRNMVTKIVPAYPSLEQRMSMAGTVKIEGIIATNGIAKSAGDI